MTSHLLRACNGGLKPRGVGQLALQLEYQPELNPVQLGIFYQEVGGLIQEEGILLRVEIDGGIVQVVPFTPPTEEAFFKAVARRLGYEPPDGVLSFLQEDGHEPIGLVSLERH